MSMLEEGRFANVAWILAEYLCKKALGMKDISEICGGHYVTKIAKSLGYYVDEELDKYLDPTKRDQYGATGDACFFISAIVSSLGYVMGGPSRGVQDDDDDYMSDQMVCSKDHVESGDDMDN
ncbi:hypothetical protein Tco_0883384 [Tanacetum coccineum]